MIVIAFHNKKIFPIFPYFIALTSLLQAAPFAKMSIVSIISGAAAKASGGDFVQGALSAMVVWLYNEWGDIFNTPDEAAIEACSAAFYKARGNKLEWHGFIYQKGKGYSYSEPTDKGATVVDTIIYKRKYYHGYRVIGYYHIHTVREYKDKMYDPEHFSQADIDVSLKGKIPLLYAYVGTLAGKVLKYEYSPLTIKNWQHYVVNVGSWKGVYTPKKNNIEIVNDF